MLKESLIDKVIKWGVIVSMLFVMGVCGFVAWWHGVLW